MTYAGEVDDLAPIYQSAKVAVAPVRFGAGLKGKVIEAALHGLPVIGTSIAWEGIPVEDGVSGIVADSASQFAEAIERLAVDQRLRMGLAEASRAWLNRFGIDEYHDALVAAVAPHQ
jgi:glycosyltransferase involved in cell wall biosynthesis